MGAPFAFFDVDTRIADADGKDLIIGPRAQPILPQLSRLFGLARARRIPVVATTCVQTAPIGAALRPEDVLVRLEGPVPNAWDQLAGSTSVFLERRSCGDGDANVAARIYDVFHANPRAEECLRRMNIRQWAVFGISLEYCLRGACTGLLRQGYEVTVLTDAVVPSPRPFGKSSGEVLEEFVSRGARLTTTASFLESLRHHG